MGKLDLGSRMESTDIYSGAQLTCDFLGAVVRYIKKYKKRKTQKTFKTACFP